MITQSAKLEDGHYSVCLPLRKKSLHMSNNRAVVEQHGLIYAGDSQLSGRIWMIFSRKDGNAVKFDGAGHEPTEGGMWYLPHH